MIDKKWKWIANDAGEFTYVFTDRPIPCTDRPVWRCDPGEYVWCGEGIFALESDWKDSLHEIIHHGDGKIEFRKARPDLKVDDPVLVKLRIADRWSCRHFASWDKKTGLIRCWDDGRTSFTAEGINSVWDEYKLP